MSLTQLLLDAARTAPGKLAVQGPDGALDYAELDALSNRVARALAGLGVGTGDRVAIWHEKSVKVVAAMQACLRLRAPYVPIDPTSPRARAGLIIQDCACAAVVTTRARAGELRAAGIAVPVLALDEGAGATAAPSAHDLQTAPIVGWSDVQRLDPSLPSRVQPDLSELAYILYTSGSTGTPKGVCISHRNALAFVGWSASAVGLGDGDRLANHAPFNFDLSVFDIYAAFLARASVHLIPETASYAPRQLVEFAQRRAISVWYSVPSVLQLMMNEGGLLRSELPALRTIVFAGEVFPIPALKRLQRGFPQVRLHNWYGPTETNVCTAYELPKLEDGEHREVPIGCAASGDLVYAVRADGARARQGEQGELWVEGPTVMLGYWGKPAQGDAPYRTGDNVLVEPNGLFRYAGRIDNQVKVRGHRIELGEIETALRTDPAIDDAAVVVAGAGLDARLVAFIVPVGDGQAPSIVQLKRVCAERLPRYMIVDMRHVLRELPRTPNGKVDRRALLERALDSLQAKQDGSAPAGAAEALREPGTSNG
jgi:amino acid adenylation domain-containing protein